MKTLERAGFLLFMVVGFWINILGCAVTLVSYLVAFFTVKPVIWIIYGSKKDNLHDRAPVEEIFCNIIHWCCNLDERIMKHLDS